MGALGQALFRRSCHEDVIFTRKSYNCAGTAFVQGHSVGGPKLTEQTLPKGLVKEGLKEKMEVPDTHKKLGHQKGHLVNSINGGGKNIYTEDQICKMVDFFLVDNIFVKFGGCLFHQVIGIPMGTNCAPLLVDLFLFSYDDEFLTELIKMATDDLLGYLTSVTGTLAT